MSLRRAFISRWYITLVGLLITAALAVAAVMYVPAQYQAKSVSLLYPPNTKLAENPLTNLSSLTGLPDVLDQTLTAPSATTKVKADGNVGTYTVANDLSSTGPLVVVTSLSDTPAHATALAKYVTKLIPAMLQGLQSQAGISVSNNYIKSLIINPVDKVTVVRKDQTRAVLVAVAVGLLLTIFLVAAAERFSTRKRRRRNVKRPQPPARRAPQPYISKSSGKAPAEMVRPVPTSHANGSRTSSNPNPNPNPKSKSKSKSTSRRTRRSRSDSDTEHEPVSTGS